MRIFTQCKYNKFIRLDQFIEGQYFEIMIWPCCSAVALFFLKFLAIQMICTASNIWHILLIACLIEQNHLPTLRNIRRKNSVNCVSVSQSVPLLDSFEKWMESTYIKAQKVNQGKWLNDIITKFHFIKKKTQQRYPRIVGGCLEVESSPTKIN